MSFDVMAKSQAGYAAEDAMACISVDIAYTSCRILHGRKMAATKSDVFFCLAQICSALSNAKPR